MIRSVQTAIIVRLFGGKIVNKSTALKMISVDRSLSVAAPMRKEEEGTRPRVGILATLVGSPLEREIADAVQKTRADIRFEVFVRGKPTISEKEMEDLKSCEILIADPNIIMDHNMANNLPNLKWMHCLWAGVDRLTRSFSPSGPFPSYLLTRNGAFFCNQMAEYVFGYIIDKERHITEMKKLKEQSVWKRLPYRTLSELTLGIVGFGDIGKEIARIAKAFQMNVWALVRSFPKDDEQCPHVDEYRLSSDLPELLAASDYVVSILPSVPSTDGFFDGDMLSHCAPKSTTFMNIGRGNVVKDETIIAAIDRGWIGGAVLDVFSVEPLPDDSPLWTHPKVIVTPHIAGLCISGSKIASDFVQNYDRFVKGETLPYTVDWDKGY